MRSLASLNRVQPKVEVKAQWQDESAGVAKVMVKVSQNKDTYPVDGKPQEVSTDVYDLRVFRDGQVVGWAPKTSVDWQLMSAPTGPNAARLDLERWRAKTHIDLQADGTATAPTRGCLFLERREGGNAFGSPSDGPTPPRRGPGCYKAASTAAGSGLVFSFLDLWVLWM